MKEWKEKLGVWLQKGPYLPREVWAVLRNAIYLSLLKLFFLFVFIWVAANQETFIEYSPKYDETKCLVLFIYLMSYVPHQ